MPIGAAKAGLLGSSCRADTYAEWPNHSDTVFWFDAREGLVDLSARGDTLTQSGGTLNGTSFEQTSASDDIYTNTSTVDFTDFSGDFTIEGDVALDATSSKCVWATTGDRIVTYDSNAYYEIVGHGSHTSIGTGRCHFCHMRVSGTLYVFKNGSIISSRSLSGSLGGDPTIFYIGTQRGYNGMTGDIYAVRYTKAALYSTSGFTAPGNYFGINT